MNANPFDDLQLDIDAIVEEQRHNPAPPRWIHRRGNMCLDRGVHTYRSHKLENTSSAPDESRAGGRSFALLRLHHYSSTPTTSRNNRDDDHVFRSKKVTARRRRSDAKDRRTLVFIGDLVGMPVVSLPPALVENHTVPFTDPLQPSNDNIPESQKAGQPTKVTARSIPAWEHTHDRMKLTFANRVLASEGPLYAWTLNLSPEVLDVAQRHPSGFCGYMRPLISRRLKRGLGRDPLFWFAVDVTKLGRLHLHGGIAANDNDRPAIEKALCDAGGGWASSGSSERQLDLTLQDRPDGWIAYTLKNSGQVRRLIEGKPICITNPLRARAKSLHNEHRNRVLEFCSTPGHG